MMILRVIVSFLMAAFLAACALSVEAPKAPDGITEPIPVTVEELVANPLKFHDQRIKVRGFLIPSYNYHFLYSSVDIFLLQTLRGDDYAKVIALDTVDAGDPDFDSWRALHDHDYQFQMAMKWFPDFPIKYNRANMEIIGTFNAICAEVLYTEEGYKRTCVDHIKAGDIVNVTSLKILGYPDIPSTVYKHVQEYKIKYRTYLPNTAPLFEIVLENDPDFTSATEFLMRWREWVGKKDIDALSGAFVAGYQEIFHKAAANPETAVNWRLFSDEYLFQKLVNDYPNVEPRLVRDTFEQFMFISGTLSGKTRMFSTKNSTPLYFGCFCLTNDCSQLWPPTFYLVASQGVADDFICTQMFKTEEGWEWDF